MPLIWLLVRRLDFLESHVVEIIKHLCGAEAALFNIRRKYISTFGPQKPLTVAVRPLPVLAELHLACGVVDYLIFARTRTASKSQSFGIVEYDSKTTVFAEPLFEPKYFRSHLMPTLLLNVHPSLSRLRI